MSGHQLLLHLDVTTDDEAQRVVLSVSRSDTASVLRGYLTPAEAQRIAHRLVAASLKLKGDQ